MAKGERKANMDGLLCNPDVTFVNRPLRSEPFGNE